MLTRFIIGRLAQLAVVLIALWFGTFFLVRMIPGDPAQRILGLNATPADVARLRASLGLDQSLGAQIGDSLSKLRHMDLGRSFVTSEPVSTVISQRLPKTAELAGAALLLVLVFGIPAGLAAGALSAGNRHRGVDVAFGASTSVAGAVPEYVWATFLAFLFAVKFGWLPAGGSDRPSSIILPALAVALAPAALLMRVVRVETLKVLGQDYIRTARSKRLPARLLYARHVLPNVLTAALTIGGLLFASLIGGTVIIENVFAWPGLGTAAVNAVLARDYPVVQATLLFLGVAVVVINTCVDILTHVVDPASK